MEYNDIFKAARDGTLRGKSKVELLSMLETCATFQASNWTSVQAAFSITVIRDELALIEYNAKHREMVSQQQRLHAEQVDMAEKLADKSSVEDGGRHRKTQCVALIGVLIAFAALIVQLVSCRRELQNSPYKAAPPSQPLLLPTVPEIKPPANTNALQASSVSGTNKPQQTNTTQ